MSKNRIFDQPCALAPRSWGLLVKCLPGGPPRLLRDRCGRQIPRFVTREPLGAPLLRPSRSAALDWACWGPLFDHAYSGRCHQR